MQLQLGSPYAFWYPDIARPAGVFLEGTVHRSLLPFPGAALAFAASPTDNPQDSAFTLPQQCEAQSLDAVGRGQGFPRLALPASAPCRMLSVRMRT